MNVGLADTSVFIASETERALDVDRLPDSIAVSAITVGELRVGVLAARDATARDRRLRTLTRALQLEPIPVDELVAEAWASLRIHLRDRGARMPLNDSWIAATALAHDLTLVTQDQDHLDIDGLDIIRV